MIFWPPRRAAVRARRTPNVAQGSSRRLVDLYLERADRTLIASVDGTFREAAAKAGPHLACRPGCGECCVGPFPITSLDTWRLRRGMEELARAAPVRVRRIRERARAAVGRLRPGFPGSPGRGVLNPDLRAQDRFYQEHEDLPCPALDPGTGRCEVYPFRPVSCRTYGPPARYGQETTDPCRLCFAGAARTEVERCRMIPDPEAIEDRILRRLAAEEGEEAETLIAFALAEGRPGGSFGI